MNTNDLDVCAVNEIKALSLDMICNAKSGNAGICMSAAPILYTLYAKHMMINPENPTWLNRDRFILASGNASATLYATLHLCGFAISREDLKQYRSLDAITPGYPDSELTPGIDMTTGLFGEGIASGVGFALAKRYIKNILESEDENQQLIDYYTYVYCTDADLMEGISYEATSIAGVQKLNQFILLCDCSKITNDGSILNTFQEDLESRFDALGFKVLTVKDGNNLKSIDKAITTAKKSKKPTVIFFETILGDGLRNQNTNIYYDTPLLDDDLFAFKKNNNITVAPFELRKDSIIYVKDLINKRVGPKYNDYISYFNKIKTSANDRLLKLMSMLLNKDMVIPFESLNFKVGENYNENLLETNHKIMNIVASKTEYFLGGSADVASSTKAFLEHSAIQTAEKPGGRNINFGIREAAMASILNGISMSGLKTYASTKLIQVDRLKNGLRLSALLNLPVSYIFTHDSIFYTEDGPLWQPVEQLTTLRSIPNMITFRPCDINELLGSWEYICKNKKCVSLVLSNTVVPKCKTTHPKLTMRGGYIVKKEEKTLDGIIIATGRQVFDALQIANDLKQENLSLRVVSMPSLELFLKEDKTYQEQILPKTSKIVVIEPSNEMSWGYLSHYSITVLGINDFGYSGHKEEVIKKYEYDYDNLKLKVAHLFYK